MFLELDTPRDAFMERATGQFYTCWLWPSSKYGTQQCTTLIS